MIGAAQWPQHQGAIQAFAPNPRMNYQQDSRRRKERPTNSGSKLLTRPENELMFEVLGPDRVSLAAGVIQLLKSVRDQWQHQHVGVVSLIKDYQRKLYSLALFDIYNGNQLWEQVLYRGFRAKTYQQCPKFLTFEGDGSVFGLNFSDDEEAHGFKIHLEKRYEQEQKGSKSDVFVFESK
ncbi:unnamed protein product [Bursaphelenchus xylophilus]|uniref:(pine wood nematode) hypothetical protein n=1 Tax=Bursaphelenchus xylophilus TaxID=6326 RepID=A0A1I7RI85_BURXY|nr:unnamed protein product [Bursaphelenchus xylophilus]CAG9115084.1 unnamed protein product [Bursaphelenchus xylophilus]